MHGPINIRWYWVFTRIDAAETWCLTNHPVLALRLEMDWRYTSTSSLCLHRYVMGRTFRRSYVSRL